MALAALVGCGSAERTDPPLDAPRDGLAVRPEGFASVAATLNGDAVTPDACELCLWLANTDEARRRGLMGVTDLGGRDGMVFVYSEPRTTNFTMRNTPTPLSIAFFDAAGDFMAAFDMEPCAAEPCPPYPTPADFTMALEVFQGDLDRLGVGPGATLELSSPDSAPAIRCQMPLIADAEP